MIHDGRAGSVPIWYQAKVVADWHNISVPEAYKLPWRDWMIAFTARHTENMAERELERRSRTRASQPGGPFVGPVRGPGVGR